MSALQTNSDTNSISALAVFILSHGEDNGTVFAQDSMYRVDHDILYPLAADKCPLLAGKPKLIFVQACQGKVRVISFLAWLLDIYIDVIYLSSCLKDFSKHA